VLLAAFVPMLFQGEEWAASSPFLYFADHDDPELAQLVSEGRKKEFAAFGWNLASIPDPEKRETFERSKLRWSEIDQNPHAEMLAWYRDLIQLRRSTPDLNNSEPGSTRVQFSEEDRWVAMKRGSILLLCNLSGATQVHPLPDGAKVVLSSREGVVSNDVSLQLPPDAAVVLRC
jgi:maltooligosyltrehalose trehalohydrolase